MKLKIGDVVTITEQLPLLESSGVLPERFGIAHSMYKYAGIQTVITDMYAYEYPAIAGKYIYRIEADGRAWEWISECFDNNRLRLVL